MKPTRKIDEKRIKSHYREGDYGRLCDFIMGKRETKKSPVYLWQCVVCEECFYSENTTEKHCGRLTQWVSGIEGKGVNMESPKIKIEVGGYIEMSLADLERILNYPDSHKGLVYSIHMGFCNSDKLQFNLPDDIEITEE